MPIDVSTLIIALLSSSVLGVIMKLIGEAIAFRRNRKAAKEDKAENSCECQTANQICELNTKIESIDITIAQRTERMNLSFEEVNAHMDVLHNCFREFLRDYIMHNALKYIDEGRPLTKDAYDSILSMHEAYHKLQGNGKLDEYITNIKALWAKQIQSKNASQNN